MPLLSVLGLDSVFSFCSFDKVQNIDFIRNVINNILTIRCILFFYLVNNFEITNNCFPNGYTPMGHLICKSIIMKIFYNL